MNREHCKKKSLALVIGIENRIQDLRVNGKYFLRALEQFENLCHKTFHISTTLKPTKLYFPSYGRKQTPLSKYKFTLPYFH